MIAAAIFTFAGIYAALTSIPTDAWFPAFVFSMVCWVMAALCALGVAT